MNAIKKLLKVADKIEKRLQKQAQTVSAQPSDVEDVLRKANLWELSNQVSPLLNVARVPDSASVKISIVVDKNLRVNFIVELNPPHASAVALARLLKNTYANKMHLALAAAKLNIADTLTLNWLTF